MNIREVRSNAVNYICGAVGISAGGIGVGMLQQQFFTNKIQCLADTFTENAAGEFVRVCHVTENVW